MRLLILMAIIFGGATQVAAQRAPITGQISYFPYADRECPTGWLPADGREMRIDLNIPLFSLLGTQYGGDGVRTYALPDMRGLAHLIGGGVWCIALSGTFPRDRTP